MFKTEHQLECHSNESQCVYTIFLGVRSNAPQGSRRIPADRCAFVRARRKGK